MVENIFITGATGCIGTYVVEQLINNPKYFLFVFVRNPKKLLAKIQAAKNVEVITGTIDGIGEYGECLVKADYVLNIATSWGGGKQSNVQGLIKMLSLVDQKRLKKFVQFETASILGRENTLLEQAKTEGTGYIKCKYDIYNFTRAHQLSDKIIRVYPTVVIGGAKDRPYSHISKGLLDFKKQLNWLKYFYIDFGFHFIHAEDIAKCVLHIMENVEDKHDLVLGNEYIVLKDFIKKAALYYNKKAIIRIKIPGWLISLVINIFRIKVSTWDRFCFKYKWFKYQTVNSRSFGLEPCKFTVKEIFDDLEKNRQ